MYPTIFALGIAELGPLTSKGSGVITIGNFGGPVVLEVARLAGEHGVPVLAVAREVDISLRELRRHGVEQAVPLGGGPELTASEITGRAGRIAAGWAR